MARNDYLPFAFTAAANIISIGEYQAAQWRPGGFVQGVAISQQLNRVWRQGSVVASALAQFVGDTLEEDMLDDGDYMELADKVGAAVRAVAHDVADALDLLHDAPSDGTLYGRRNGAWEAAVRAADLAALLDGYLLKSGGTMTGFITLHANPVNPMHAATRQYVDQAIQSILAGSGYVPEAPLGTAIYGRRNAAWVDLSGYYVPLTGTLPTQPMTGLLDINLNTTGAIIADNGGGLLRIQGANSANAGATVTAFNATPRFILRGSGGTRLAQAAIGVNFGLGQLNIQGWDGTGFFPAGLVSVFAAEGWTATAHGARMELATTPIGATAATVKVSIDPAGNVLLGGTAQLQGQRFIANSGGWPQLAINNTTDSVAFAVGVGGSRMRFGPVAGGTLGSVAPTAAMDIDTALTVRMYGQCQITGALTSGALTSGAQTVNGGITATGNIWTNGTIGAAGNISTNSSLTSGYLWVNGNIDAAGSIATPNNNVVSNWLLTNAVRLGGQAELWNAAGWAETNYMSAIQRLRVGGIELYNWNGWLSGTAGLLFNNAQFNGDVSANAFYANFIQSWGGITANGQIYAGGNIIAGGSVTCGYVWSGGNIDAQGNVAANQGVYGNYLYSYGHCQVNGNIVANGDSQAGGNMSCNGMWTYSLNSHSGGIDSWPVFASHGHLSTIDGQCAYRFISMPDAFSVNEYSDFWITHNLNLGGQIFTCDQRYKRNITEEHRNALAAIRGVKFYSYDRTDWWGNQTEHENMGLLAQQVAETMPDIVTDTPEPRRPTIEHDGVCTGEPEYRPMQGINTLGLLAYMIEAIQELGARVEQLEGRA